MSRILIVDDEASICWAFREFLADEGHDVSVAASAEEGFEIADGGALDAVVLDVRLPGMDGLTALSRFREQHRPRADHRHHGVRQPGDRGAGDGGRGLRLPGQALRPRPGRRRRQASAREGQAAKPGRPGRRRRRPSSDALIGSSPAMQELFKSIALVASTDVPVLITGESGTGKELVARAIHRHSRRRGGPFLPVCLSASSPGLVEGELFGHLRGSFTGASQDRKGLLELASGGSVLLDEVGDIPPATPGQAPTGHRAPRGDAGRRRPAAANRHPGHRRDQSAAR